jgi:hypothetical protein
MVEPSIQDRDGSGRHCHRNGDRVQAPGADGTSGDCGHRLPLSHGLAWLFLRRPFVPLAQCEAEVMPDGLLDNGGQELVVGVRNRHHLCRLSPPLAGRYRLL